MESTENQKELYWRGSRVFGVRNNALVNQFPQTTARLVLGKPLHRSANSVAANYRASCIARSTNEKFTKMSTVVEEADSTSFWIKLTLDSRLSSPKSEEQSLQQEAHELSKIFAAYHAKLKHNP